MNQNPRFNVEKLEFECFCKYDVSFNTMQKFKTHCKSKSHQAWKTENKVNDEIEIPLCQNCFDPMSDPRLHLSQCINKQVTGDLDTRFQQKIDSCIDKFQKCTACGTLVFLTVLSSARVWKDKTYCGPCCDLLFSADEIKGHTLVKLGLLHDTDSQCVLCLRPILTSDRTIYEHMNPFLKTHDPSACLRIGQNPITVLEQCRTQGVKVVHLICAQIKTILEQDTQQIQAKKNLKRKNISEISLEDRKQKKVAFYEETILPKISNFIRDWTKSQDPSHRNPQKNFHVMTRVVETSIRFFLCP